MARTYTFYGTVISVHAHPLRAFAESMYPEGRAYHVYLGEKSDPARYLGLIVSHWGPGDRGGHVRYFDWYAPGADLVYDGPRNWSRTLRECVWENCHLQQAAL